ncbi:MAG: UDP-N-acetylmuramate dehydrogenase [Acidobacteriota bacterium]
MMKKSGLSLSIRENVPLAPFTTLGVGGPARFLANIKHEDQIADALEFARVRACPLFILGGGSNIVVSDSGFQGLVVRMEIRGLQHLDGENGGLISVAAGENWDGFVERCVELNLAGLECLSGIPGTVGGAPVQNIGAYGEEVSNAILSTRVFDRESESFEELSGTDCRFEYRSSIFNTTQRDRYIIIKAAFALRPYGKPQIQYPDLQYQFSDRSKIPTVREVRRAVLQIRESKGMVLNAVQNDLKSAGSFFKNPVLDPEKVVAVENRARDRGVLGPSETLPRFAAPAGMEKLPAAWLVEHAGFKKGFTLGNVGISPKHSLAFINHGGAETVELISLMKKVQEKVYSDFGVLLKPEPTFIGFDKSFDDIKT